MIKNLLSGKIITRVTAHNFSKTNLKGRSLHFEWQNQQSGPEKTTPKWETKEEIYEKKKKIFQTNMTTDHRMDIFDLHPRPEVQEPMDDEVFGFETPEARPFDKEHVIDMFKLSLHSNRDSLNDSKLAYLTEFMGPYEIKDKELKVILDELLSNVDQFYAKHGVEKFMISKSDWDEFFLSSHIQIILRKALILIKRVNYTHYPDIILFLDKKVFYRKDYANDTQVFGELEYGIKTSLHLFTHLELLKIYYGLNSSYPKKCSTYLRKTIREKIFVENFDIMSVDHILMIYQASKLENNTLKVQKKCFNYLVANKKSIQEICKNRDHKLALNIFYTYANSRVMKRFRKKLDVSEGKAIDIHSEDDAISDLYLPLVTKYTQEYNEIEWVRLVVSLKILKIKDMNKVYLDLGDFILQRISTICPLILSELLYRMASNERKSQGSRKFWDSMKLHLPSVIERLEPNGYHEFAQLVFSMVTNKILSFEEFEKLFGNKLIKLLGSKDKFSYFDLNLVSYSFLILDIHSKDKNQMKPYFKELLYCLSHQKEFVPLYYYFKFKLLIYYMENRFPNWNYEIFLNLCYASEKLFSAERLRIKKLPASFMLIYDLIKNNMEMNIYAQVNFENLFLINLANEDYKFAIFIQNNTDYLHRLDGEPKTTEPYLDIKKEILTLRGWTICCIDYDEFTEMGEKRAEWISEKIKSAFAIAVKKNPNIKEEKVQKFTERIERVVMMDVKSDPTHPLHLKKALLLAKLKEREDRKALK